MSLQEVKQSIENVKQEIDEILEKKDENRELEIIRILNRPEVKLIVAKDNQLLTLSKIYSIWLAERKFGCTDYLFDRFKSLNEAEDIYMNLKYYCRRFEYDMPEEYLWESIEYIKEKNITGIALYNIVMVETWKKERILLELAHYLKVHKQLLTATVMLQFAVKQYDKNKKIIMELADCWIEGQQWEQAYLTLKKIQKPSPEVKEIITELEEVVCNESL